MSQGNLLRGIVNFYGAAQGLKKDLKLQFFIVYYGHNDFISIFF